MKQDKTHYYYAIKWGTFFSFLLIGIIFFAFFLHQLQIYNIKIDGRINKAYERLNSSTYIVQQKLDHTYNNIQFIYLNMREEKTERKIEEILEKSVDKVQVNLVSQKNISILEERSVNNIVFIDGSNPEIEDKWRLLIPLTDEKKNSRKIAVLTFNSQDFFGFLDSRHAVGESTVVLYNSKNEILYANHPINVEDKVYSKIFTHSKKLTGDKYRFGDGKKEEFIAINAISLGKFSNKLYIATYYPTSSGSSLISSILFTKSIHSVIYLLLILSFLSVLIITILYRKRKDTTTLKTYAEIDCLTKVYNRRKGFEIIKEQMNHPQITTISFCFVDIDYLKLINDELGHRFGDDLLKRMTDTVKATIRENDYIIRVGGDEFIIVFPSTTKEMAEVIWGSIEEELSQINESGECAYYMSASHGVSQYTKGNQTTLEKIIQIADDRMYEEKALKRTHEECVLNDSIQ